MNKKLNSKQALDELKALAKSGAVEVKTDGKINGIDSFKVSPKRDADGKILYPTETSRDTIETLVGQSYLVKDENGDFLPNYNVMFENFAEVDNSIDLQQFCDVRVAKRNSTHNFQTDSLISSKDKETNSTGDDNGSNSPTREKELRNVKVTLTEEYGTETSEINIRDIESEIVAFDLLASDLQQHKRTNLLQSNRFILSKMIEGADIVDTGYTYDPEAADKDAEFINLGKQIYPVIKQAIVDYKEYMTVQRPGGFDKSVINVILSPLASRACVDYQTSLSSGDKSFVTATNGELYNFTIEGVRVYETNLLKGGQKLDVKNAAGELQTEFENNDNVEVLIVVDGYLKYIKAEPYVKSSPMIINRQEVPHVIGQFTENMHNGVMIIDGLFKGISFSRVVGAKAATISTTVSDLTVGTSAIISSVDGTDINGDPVSVIDYTSSDETIATADAAGVVTGVAAGVATITATTSDGSATDPVSIDFTVTANKEVEELKAQLAEMEAKLTKKDANEPKLDL